MGTRWLACALLGLALGCAAAPPPVRLLREAELWIGSSSEPPGADAAWKPALLPDRWLAEHPQHRWTIADRRQEERAAKGRL